MLRVAFLFLWFANTGLHAVQSPLGTPDEVAKLFGYPANKLVVGDVTDSFRETFGPAVMCAYEYTSKDQTFAPITIVVGKTGTILSQELLASIEESFRISAEAAGKNKSLEGKFVRKLDFGNGVTGHAMTFGMGPGGAQWGAVLTFPRQHLDVRISTFLSSSAPLRFTDETKKYYDEVSENEHFWIDRLSVAAKAAADRILSKAFLAEIEKSSR